MSDVKVKITADNSGLEAGLKKAKGDVDKFAKETEGALTGLGSKIAAVFTVGAIVSAVKSALDFAGAIQDASDALDMSAESLQGLQGAFGQSGVGADKFRAGMSELNKSLQEARDNTGTARSSFDALGIKWEDIRDKSPEEILYLISDGMKNAKDRTEALTAVMDLLGKSGKAMASGLSEGSEALRKNAEDVTKLTSDEVKAIDALGDAWTRAGDAVKVFMGRAVLALTKGPTPTDTTGMGSGAAQSQPGNIFMGMGGLAGAKAMKDAQATKQAEQYGPEYAPQYGPEYTPEKAGRIDPILAKQAEEAAKLQEKEIEGVWKQMDAEKKITEERQKQLDQDAEEYDNLVKAEKMRRDKLEMEKLTTDQRQRQADLDKVNQDVDDAENAMVAENLKTADQRREDRRQEGREKRAQSRVDRMKASDTVRDTRPGSGKKMEEFKELKSLQEKMTKSVEEINKTIKAKLGTA